MADSAQYGQYGQYGTPSENVSILVDKTVSQNTSDYVDNLPASDYRFKPGQKVYFKIHVKNTSDSTINNVTVTDELPDYVESLDNSSVKDQVSYDKNNRLLTIKAGSMNANAEKDYYITVNIVAQSQLPADQGVVCVTNKATASADNVSPDSDTAQFCAEKQVTGVTTVPSTGPEMGILLMGGQVAMLGLGIALRRRVA